MNPSTLNVQQILDQIYNQKKQYMIKLDTQASAMQATKDQSFLIGSVDSAGNFSMASNPTKQDSGTSARLECRRLAATNPGKFFFIMQLRGGELVPTTSISI